MDHRPSIELLESSHTFPGHYQIKAIGSADDDFTSRVLETVVAELAGPDEVEHSIRTTQNGRHHAITMNMKVQSAEQVRAIYAKIHEVPGLTMLL